MGVAAKAEQDYRECLKEQPAHAHAGTLVSAAKRDELRGRAQTLVADWIAGIRSYHGVRGRRLPSAYGDLPSPARIAQGLNLDPHDERSLTEMALTYEALNRNDRALVLYQKILERKPGEMEVVDRVNVLLAKGAKQPHPE